MKIYFGEVSREDAEEYGFDCYEYEGNLFDYAVEFTQDDVIISDSCNRSIPMDWAGFHALVSLVKLKYNEIDAIATAFKNNGLLSYEEDALVAAA